MSSLRHHLFTAGFVATTALRADRWLRPLAQGAGVILMLHHVRPWVRRSFAPNRLLEITPEFLDRVLALVDEMGFELVSLDEVPARLRNGGQPFAAITFDDGYRDTVEHALPVLRRHAAPFTVFVTTQFAEGAGRLWWLELEEAVAWLDRISVNVGEETIAAPASTAEEKQAAFERLYWALRRGPEERLRATVALLAEAAGVDGARLVRTLCLGWDEIAALAREPNVTIGAHTLSHPMLAKWPAAVARREMAESKAGIEERLAVPVRHFAYPVGDPASAGAREFALAEEVGFVTAATTRPGHLFPAHASHLHALPRVSVNGLYQSEEALRAMLSGVPFLAWNRGRRVNVA
ncbi:MAG TPA: polysaccharide deacetylase family protein [Beijerinckiaceae bacterium]|jgi:peptidoglycan/xylan/chitin deacetylase (PgdA/CDA1 family)|nr:polysaccharide deacetylase family protein [Beijerinckiaceae bacterium]